MRNWPVRLTLKTRHRIQQAAIALACLFVGGFLGTWGLRNFIRDAPCRQRQSDADARFSTLRREANQQLPPGTSKEALTRFFTAHGMDMDIEPIGDQIHATGDILIPGLPQCKTQTCNTDAVLIELRVPVDQDGVVVSDPILLFHKADCKEPGPTIHRLAVPIHQGSEWNGIQPYSGNQSL
jgi:hypothetical protein